MIGYRRWVLISPGCAPDGTQARVGYMQCQMIQFFTLAFVVSGEALYPFRHESPTQGHVGESLIFWRFFYHIQTFRNMTLHTTLVTVLHLSMARNGDGIPGKS